MRVWRGLGGEMQDEALTRTIIGCAYRMHGTLKAGFSEKVYVSTEKTRF